MHVESPRYSGGWHVLKRAMYIVLAAAAMLVLLPALLVLLIFVRLDSPGPALFFQERVGRSGETFKMAKDPRITRCGHWMRKFCLDELPQFWNVLRGDMSLVGPRPLLHEEMARYERPASRRLLITPGITGLWQISGRSDLARDESVRLDLYYVENWSLTGDLIILWRTFKAVVEPVGAYQRRIVPGVRICWIGRVFFAETACSQSVTHLTNCLLTPRHLTADRGPWTKTEYSAFGRNEY